MTAPRILVVEDERIIALHLRQQLTALGYEVVSTVATGDQALRKIEQTQPDLVLMDINLKGRMDGIATAAAIPPEYHIPVIYLTAYAADATLERAAATHPYGYLLKPFNERELHAMIQMTLARSRAERASRTSHETSQQARKMEALRQLAGGLADEVTDLLTILYGQLEELGDQALDEPAMAEPIQEAFGEAIEKERLVQNLLDFSGRRKLTPAAVSLHDVASHSVGQLRHIVGETVRVELDLPCDLWPALIDARQLTRALTLLAANARDAMQGGGSLTIEGRNTSLRQNGSDGPWAPNEAAGRYVLLRVRDTGTGMSDRVIERAFEPFFTTKPPGGGTGLGLSLVFGFIRQSGGHISIDSKPGGGTTVMLYLPAAPEDLPVVAAGIGDGPSGLPPGPFPHGAAELRPKIGPRTTAANRARRDGGGFRHGPPGATSADLAAPVPWHKSENALYATISVHPDQPRYRLMVEPLPRRDGWDWTVWRTGDTEAISRYGRASTVVSAMAAAEDAARHWGKIGAPVD